MPALPNRCRGNASAFLSSFHLWNLAARSKLIRNSLTSSSDAPLNFGNFTLLYFGVDKTGCCDLFNEWRNTSAIFWFCSARSLTASPSFKVSGGVSLSPCAMIVLGAVSSCGIKEGETTWGCATVFWDFFLVLVDLEPADCFSQVQNSTVLFVPLGFAAVAFCFCRRVNSLKS